MFEFCISPRGFELTNPDSRRSLRAMGIRQLSIGPQAFMNGSTSRDDVLRLRDMLEADGLCAVTSHPPFGSFNEPFSTLRQDPAGLKEDLKWLREYIIRCGLLGVKAIPLHTGGAMLPKAQPWEIASARRYIEALLPAAERAGVVIAVENTNHATPIGFYPGMTEQVPLNRNIWEFDDTHRILDFVHGFDSPFVKICYDTGHSHLLGKMLPDLDAFLPDVVLFHIHDNDGAGNDAHIQPGYGNSPWKAFFERIAGTDAPLFVEAGPFFGDVQLMMDELRAVADGRVAVKSGGFLLKDENTGRIVINPEPEAAVSSAAGFAQDADGGLSFLFNRHNLYQDHAPREITEARLPFIGVSSEVPRDMAARMAEVAPVTLFDSCCALGDDLNYALDMAESLRARWIVVSAGEDCIPGTGERQTEEWVKDLRAQCSARNLELLLTNRRREYSSVPVSAEKLSRLCAGTGVRLAFDIGASHAAGRALEDFYDLHSHIAALLLNDNFGLQALCPVGHEDYEPGVAPDDMRQPGYGTAPYPALGEAIRTFIPGVPMFINGRRHQNITPVQVLRETRPLLAGKVFINPAGGSIGKGDNGRLIV